MFNDIITWFGEWGVENYMAIGGKILKIILIWVGAKILIRVGSFLIKGFFDGEVQNRISANKARNITLKGLTQSVLKYVVYFIAILMILAEMGVDTTSVIATAGIGGLAIGFGAQSLVKDVITGFFIIFEDQYGVGDFIEVEGTSGTVEEIGLRITKIRASRRCKYNSQRPNN